MNGFKRELLVISPPSPHGYTQRHTATSSPQDPGVVTPGKLPGKLRNLGSYEPGCRISIHSIFLLEIVAKIINILWVMIAVNMTNTNQKRLLAGVVVDILSLVIGNAI